MRKTGRVAYSDSYISTRHYSYCDVILDADKRDYAALRESRDSISSQSELVDRRDRVKDAMSSRWTSLRDSLHRVCCCCASEPANPKKSNQPEHHTNRSEDGVARKEEVTPLRGQPNGKEKHASLSTDSNMSAHEDSPPSGRDVEDCDSSDSSGGQSREMKTALEKSRQCELQDEKKEYLSRKGRESIFTKMSNF